MSLKPQEVDQLNKVVSYWAQNARRSMERTVRVSNVYRDGQIDAAGFKFKRHLVFVEMGVFGGLTRERANAAGKLKPMPWFNPVIRRQVPRLEKKVLDLFENLVVNAARLEIKNT
jgi:hypothetical protein